VKELEKRVEILSEKLQKREKKIVSTVKQDE
jgi:hypothetical protein